MKKEMLTQTENARERVLYHLFLHPLYETVPHEDEGIQVFLFGMGQYGTEFLDAALQLGQIIGKKLTITVFDADISVCRERYLNARPALNEFFEIDGVPVDGESYGSLNFAGASFSQNSEENIRQIETHFDDKLDYVFVALGSDELNFSAAEACLEAAEILDGKTVVCFPATQRDIADKARACGLIPIEITLPIEQEPLFSEIERMAFNVHLLWTDGSRGLEEEKRLFREPYTHYSCVSNILSMKSKLYGIQVSYNETEIPGNSVLKKAADDFSEIIKDNLAALMWIEHRRWVVEKLCDGYRPFYPQDCPYGETRKKAEKKHLCLVRSRQDRMLFENERFWDKASAREIKTLDPLDEMSVLLHRRYVKKAEALMQNHPLDSESFDAVRALGDRKLNASAAFRAWHNCMIDIFDGNIAAARRYRPLKHAFCMAAGNINPDNDIIRRFEQQFLPFVERLLYIDFKDIDRRFIEAIPFVLTYDPECCLIVPLQTGSNDALFQCVASSLIINPKTLILLTDRQDSEEKNALNQINSLLSAKNLHTKAEVRHTSDLNTLQYLSETHRLVAFKENDSGICGKILKRRIPPQFVCYRFRMSDMSFSADGEICAFSYIQNKAALSAADMAKFVMSTGKSVRPEFNEDISKLWSLYERAPYVWKALCTDFGEAVSANLTTTFQIQPKEKPSASYRYILTYSCYEVVKALLKDLVAHGVLSQGDYKLQPINSSRSFAVTISDRYGREKKFNHLFSNPYLLTDSNALSVYYKREWVVAVELSDLRAENVSYYIDNASFGGSASSIKAADKNRMLIEDLAKMGYLLNPVFGENHTVSFYFATPDIKHLLTTAGNLLEVYLYHQPSRSYTLFDDIVNSFEINWENSYSAKNELDLVVTKGFRSAVIECKARKPDLKFYQTLTQIIRGTEEHPHRRFGINTIPVIACDAIIGSKDMDAIRLGYEEYGVITVYQKDELQNFAETVRRILDGEYHASFS